MAELTAAEAAAVGCILFADDDVEARIGRMCPHVLYLPCSDGTPHPGGAVLSCVRDAHPDGELHRDIDGIEWRQVTR